MAKSLATMFLIALAALHAPAFGADTLARIKSAQAINIAYSADSLPFSFVAGDAREPKGYSIDLCKRIVAQIGRAVGVPNLKVNWIAGSTPERLRMVAGGKADLECANTTQTLARMADVDFSALIFLETGGFAARADAPARVADMGGRKIAVLRGTTTEGRLRETLKARLVNAEVLPIERATDGIAMLESGAADYYAGDRIKLVGLAAQAKDPSKLVLLREEISYEPYALALPRNDSALRLEVNRALSQVYASGEIAPIYGQWLGALGAPWDLLKAMYLLNSIPD
jgi:ABC-type amino acid transport substrate-binding protein